MSVLNENSSVVNSHDGRDDDQYVEERSSEELMYDSSVSKRLKINDSTEGWVTVTNQRRLGRKTLRHELEEEEAEDLINVCVTDKEKLPKQFKLAKLFKEQNVTGISKVRYVNPYKLNITFENDLNAEAFLKCKTFLDMGWKLFRTSEVGISYGLVEEIEEDITISEFLKEATSNIKIVSAFRLNKRNREKTCNEDAWIPSEKLRVGFKGSVLPNHIFIHNMRVLVKPYVFPVTQCSKCWKFGHPKKFCTHKKMVCPKCMGDHESCETTKFKCPNCYMDHIALDKVCPVYIKEKRLRQLMAEFNCTYKKALMLYVPPSPSQPRESNFHSKPTNSAIQLDVEIKANPVSNYVEDSCTNKKNKKTSSTEKNHVREKKSHQKKKNSNIEDVQNWDSVSMTSYRSDIDSNTSIEQENQPQKKKIDTSFRRLMNQIKNIMSNSESMSDKFISVLKLFGEWIISWIVDVFKDGSLFNLILKYGSKS